MRSDFSEHLKENGVVDIRFSMFMKGPKKMILGRITLNEDGKEVDMKTLGKKLCLYASAYDDN